MREHRMRDIETTEFRDNSSAIPYSLCEAPVDIVAFNTGIIYRVMMYRIDTNEIKKSLSFKQLFHISSFNILRSIVLWNYISRNDASRDTNEKR